MRRRKVIGAIGTLATIGTVSGANTTSDSADEDYGLSEEDKRLRDKIRNAFVAQGHDGVKRVLVEEEVPHNLVKARSNNSSQDDTSVEATVQRYSESNSNLTIGVWPTSDGENRIFAQALAELDNPTDSIVSPRDARNVNDVIGITYNGDHWSRVGNPTHWTDQGDQIDPQWYSQSLEDGGIAAEVDLKGFPWSAKVAVETPLENLDGVAGQVWASYDHTWALNYGNSINSVTGGAGPIDVNLDWGAKSAWNKYDPTDTDDII